MNISRWRIVYLVVYLLAISLSFLGIFLEMRFLNFTATAMLLALVIWLIANRKKLK